MTVKDYRVKAVELSEIRAFVEEWHYSGSVNGVTIRQCFGLFDAENLIGAMIYGSLGMANSWRKYGTKENHVVELRRLCCIDDTPKNTESFFIGKSLKWLKKNTDIVSIVSYADTNFGHDGTIYRAANFEHVGMTAAGRVIAWNGRHYHDKTIRTYYTNKDGYRTLKPYAQRLRDALQTGEAFYIKTQPKHIYLYKLRKNDEHH